MGDFFRRLLIYVAIFIGWFGVFAAPVSAYTSPGASDGYVSDFAHVLTSDQQRELEQALKSYEQETTNELAVVTVQSVGNDSIESFVSSLFQEWGIGKKEKNNGVLLLLAIKDRKLRVEVGYGLESMLTDAASARIIQDAKSPLRAADYHGAITQMVAAIEATLTPSTSVGEACAASDAVSSQVTLYTKNTPFPPKKSDELGDILILQIMMGLFIVGFVTFHVLAGLYLGISIALTLVILSVEKSRGTQWTVMREWLKRSKLFNPIHKGLTSKPGEFKSSSLRSSSGFSSSSGSSHSSFGGGSSGGGGASGSW